MGHQRLGDIPKSRKWSALIEAVAGEGAGAGGGLSKAVLEIADLTLVAAQAGLKLAIDDTGLRYTFYLLTQVVLAAREPDWQQRLADVGIHVSNESSLFDCTVEVQGSIDRHLASHGRPTDISEMAQQAAGQAITELAGQNARTLFGNGADDLQDALHRLSTSQCIDRRMAVLAAGLEAHDAECDYDTDVFRGPRKEGYDKNMAVDYVRHALELNRMAPEEMAARFNRELGRAVRFYPKRSEAAQQFVELHKRHGRTVENVVLHQLQSNLPDLIAGTLAASSLLALVAGQVHKVPVWQRFADRVTELLQAGVPTACKSFKPKNEPHLQEICDGLLNGHNGTLIREFPFLRWGSNMTKPDWSAEEFALW